MAMIKRVVYTAIFGGYDNLIEPRKVDPSIDYVCFTDNAELSSAVWRIICLNSCMNDIDNAKLNRQYKFLPHVYFPDYDESLYIDGNIEIVSNNLSKAFEYALSNSDISIPKHTDRDCIYEEAEACIKLGKGEPKKINKQILLYESKNYPKHNGLFENNVIFRRHNKDSIVKLMEQWHEAIYVYSGRDQLSLCFLLWVNSIKCMPFFWGPKYSNKFFKIRFHRNEMRLPILKKIHLHILLNKNVKWYFYLIDCILKRVRK